LLPLIDTHQHLIYPDRLGYSWAGDEAVLAGRAFTLEDYQGLTRDAGIAGTVFMEADVDAGRYRAEAEMVAALAREPGSGILGQIAACRPEAADFEPWLDAADDLGIVGYRRVLHVVPDEVSRDDRFRENLRRIGARGRAFDMVFLARQLPVARELAAACDGTALVLDHCGVPEIAGAGLDPWRGHLSALSELPHVHVKLSGVFAYCAPGEASLETVRPYLEHVIDCFGPERCLWGSDWPVVNLRSDLPAWFAATREFLAELSDDEAAEVAHRTAERVYGVRLPLGA
jgi:predicted TIM-barrel fold metal-dependent hydrolase